MAAGTLAPSPDGRGVRPGRSGRPEAGHVFRAEGDGTGPSEDFRRPDVGHGHGAGGTKLNCRMAPAGQGPFAAHPGLTHRPVDGGFHQGRGDGERADGGGSDVGSFSAPAPAG